MKAIQIILPSLLLVALGFAQDIPYNFTADQDFSKHKTFQWVSMREAEQLDQLTDQPLKIAVDAEMAKKGLTKTDSDNPDFYSGYQVSLRQERQFTPLLGAVGRSETFLKYGKDSSLSHG